MHACRPMSARRQSVDRREGLLLAPPPLLFFPSMDIHEPVRLDHTRMRTVVLYFFQERESLYLFFSKASRHT
jgi:hypothetical protein